LLLDGLDEVQGDNRSKCVQKLNQFYRESGVEMVVCSRTEDYDKLTAKLEFQSAISIKPLESYQIDHFLGEFDERAVNVRKILAEDRLMKEMAR
jgi:predicted NACHT family NTPase